MHQVHLFVVLPNKENASPRHTHTKIGIDLAVCKDYFMLRGEPLIIVGGCRADILILLFFPEPTRHLLFLAGTAASFFFSILPDPPPPTMINGSALSKSVNTSIPRVIENS